MNAVEIEEAISNLAEQPFNPAELTSLPLLGRHSEGLAMRYERSLTIPKQHENPIKLLGSGSYSSPSLAEKLSVSEQTVYRNILFLKRQGHSIESVRLSKERCISVERNQTINSSQRRVA